MQLEAMGFLEIIVSILLIIIIVQQVSSVAERKRLTKHNDDLMSRLMSRDYTAYAAGQAVSQPAARRTISEYFNSTKKDQPEKDESESSLGMPVT